MSTAAAAAAKRAANLKWAVCIAAGVGGFLAFPFLFVDFKNSQPMRASPLSPAGVRSVRTELYTEESKHDNENPFRNQVHPKDLPK